MMRRQDVFRPRCGARVRQRGTLIRTIATGLSVIVLGVGLPVAGRGQEALPPMATVEHEPVVRLSLAQFVAYVGRYNIDYATQAFNVPIADAQVSIAHLFPNPSLSYGAGFDVSGQHQATSYDIALTQTILLGGKRGARTDVARGQRAAAKAQLDDFLRTLRGTAASADADAVYAEQVYRRSRQTAEDLDQLVTLNERRVAAGDIGEIDLVQSRVDAAQFRAQLVSAANTVRTTRLAMTALLTPHSTDTLVGPTDPTEGVAKDGSTTASDSLNLSVDSLIHTAVASRPDVVAAHRLLDAAQAGIRVARGDRWSDIDVSVGTSYFGRGTNPIDPTPVFSSVSVGISLPLPFSNFTHGEISSARYTANQAALVVQSTEWKAAVDVRQAWNTFQATRTQMAQYTNGILLDAERVRRAKLYSYQHGAASLLDVLTAEQTMNSAYLASYDAHNQYTHALIALGQATGIWSFVYTATENPQP
jgi:cobalt-zinc-cadmium efflux system outer membrane protein